VDCGLEKYKRTCTLASSQSNPSYHFTCLRTIGFCHNYLATFNSDLKATLDIHLRRELELDWLEATNLGESKVLGFFYTLSRQILPAMTSAKGISILALSSPQPTKPT
jgi:hypothetical protein